MTLSPLTDNRPETHSSRHLIAGNAQARVAPLHRAAVAPPNATRGAVPSFTAVRSPNLRANTIAASAAIQTTHASRRDQIPIVQARRLCLMQASATASSSGCNRGQSVWILSSDVQPPSRAKHRNDQEWSGNPAHNAVAAKRERGVDAARHPRLLRRAMAFFARLSSVQLLANIVKCHRWAGSLRSFPLWV